MNVNTSPLAFRLGKLYCIEHIYRPGFPFVIKTTDDGRWHVKSFSGYVSIPYVGNELANSNTYPFRYFQLINALFIVLPFPYERYYFTLTVKNRSLSYCHMLVPLQPNDICNDGKIVFVENNSFFQQTDCICRFGSRGLRCEEYYPQMFWLITLGWIVASLIFIFGFLPTKFYEQQQVYWGNDSRKRLVDIRCCSIISTEVVAENTALVETPKSTYQANARVSSTVVAS